MWQRLVDFFQDVWLTLLETLLYIGNPYDFIFAVLDIVILSLIFYQIIKLIRDSRAWQLLKGLSLILFIGALSNFLGLTALGFLLAKTISILAIAFVVLFQPELRRALETVGRAGFKVVTTTSPLNGFLSRQSIEALVQSCEEMGKKRTGALIVIERQTPLGDLEDQENAVAVDANISTTMLKQIFYVGSPLHDGAVLIRHGRIAAARVHIPLTDSYHLRKDLGTRHRAAIGASEIGDTIAIVVSEEHGTISITIGGHLYTLDNSDALRMQLYRLLLPEEADQKKRLVFKSPGKEERGAQPPRKVRAGLAVASVLIATFFWFYVQFTINPVVQRSYQVQLLYSREESLAEHNLAAQYKIEDVNVTLRGRKNTLDGLTNRDVKAYVDLSQVKEAGSQELSVQVETKTRSYTKVDTLSPSQVSILVRPHLKDGY